MPPAYPLIYSQIPFYMKDLTDTSSIVRMIKVQSIMHINGKFFLLFRKLDQFAINILTKGSQYFHQESHVFYIF